MLRQTGEIEYYAASKNHTYIVNSHFLCLFLTAGVGMWMSVVFCIIYF